MAQNDRILWHAKLKKFDENLYKLICYPDKSRKPRICIFEPKNLPQPLQFLKLSESLSRSKSKIFEYAYCNDFDYFVTLTLNPDKHDSKDLKTYISKLSRFLRYYRSQYSANIQYVLIPEQHKSGAWHMHGLIKGIPQSKLIVNKNGYLDWPDYQIRFGFVSLSKIKSKVACSKYITKYVTKTLLQNKNAKTYYSSRDLKTAKDINLTSGYTTNDMIKYLFKFKYDFQNRYCMLKTLNKDSYDILLKNYVDKQQSFNQYIDSLQNELFDL